MNIFKRFRRSPFVLPLALFAGLVLIVITETAYQQATASLDALSRTSEARSHLQMVLRRAVDAESGQRGFLLTGRAQYLEPYNAALDDIKQSLVFIDQYYAADPENLAMARRLEQAVQSKFSELETTLVMYREGRHEQWREMMLLDIGREKMSEIRDDAEYLLAQETRRIEAGRKRVYSTLLLHRVGVVAMCLVSLLALALYLRQARVLEAQRELRQQQMRKQRDEFEREVERRTQQLTELAQHLQTAREDERSRLARELHDELGALLTAAKLDAARIKSRLGSSPEALERLAHLSETLNSGIALKRRIIEDLRPSTLVNFGLVPALEILVRDFTERSQIQVESQLEPVSMRPADELTAYRLVQEAFTNIVKHARASRVQVSVGAGDGGARVSVKDNGIGFAPDTTRTSAHGLLGMRYRVEASGGRLVIMSKPGHGTRITARLPLVGPAQTPPARAADAMPRPRTT